MAHLSFASVSEAGTLQYDDQLMKWHASQESDVDSENEQMMLQAQYPGFLDLFLDSERTLRLLLSFPAHETAAVEVPPSAVEWARELLLEPHSSLAQTCFAIAIVCLSQAHAHTEDKFMVCNADDVSIMTSCISTVLAASAARFLELLIEENSKRRTSAIIKSEVGVSDAREDLAIKILETIDQKGIMLQRSRDLVLNSLQRHGPVRVLQAAHLPRTWTKKLVKSLACRCHARDEILRCIEDLKEDMTAIPTCMHMIEMCKFRRCSLDLGNELNIDKMLARPTCLTQAICAHVVMCESMLETIHQLEEEERMKPYIRLSIIMDYVVDRVDITDVESEFRNERDLWIDIIDEILPSNDEMLRSIYELVEADKEKGFESQASMILPSLQSLPICYKDVEFLEKLLSV